MSDVREVLTWERFGEASRDLAQQIVDSGWIPDLIIAVARGGLIPAGALSYALDIKAIGSINVEFYTGIGTTLAEPLLLPPFMEVSAALGKRALVVDDVADSGKTLKLVMDMVSTHGLLDPQGNSIVFEARSAVLYEKPQTIVKPDYCWKTTSEWISFPWSTLPPVTA